MKKKVITLSQLERLFDESNFTSLFVHRGTSEDDSPFDAFESDFSRHNFDDYTVLSFPLKNYCVERYMLDNHSFTDGKVLVRLGLPFSISKKEHRMCIEEIYPSWWKFAQITKDNLGEKGYKDMLRNMHHKLHQKYTSFLKSSEQTKKCLFGIQYQFIDTNKKDEENITKLLDELFESDTFVDFVGTVLVPIIMYWYLDKTSILIASLKKTRATINSLLFI